jgi:hypothetical protein
MPIIIGAKIMSIPISICIIRDAIIIYGNIIGLRVWARYGNLDYGASILGFYSSHCLTYLDMISWNFATRLPCSDAIWMNTTYNIGKQWRLYGYILNGVGPTGISCFDCNDWLGDSKWSIATRQHTLVMHFVIQ